MILFDQLAQRVEKEWSALGGQLDGFTDIATKALSELEYDLSLEDLNQQIQEWLLKSSALPQQISVHNTFGQPSLTVFNNGRFVVDIYIWVDFDTSIHSHGFRGAFRVLHGQSLQENFTVQTEKKLAEDISLVDMSDIQHERLIAGDVRAIAPGSDLTHRVIHLENPTITLCVKTINEPALKQWTYLQTGLAVQKQNANPDMAKRVYSYQYLFSQNEVSADQFLSDFLEQLDISSQIHLYEDVASGAYGISSETIERIVERIVSLHEGSEWWTRYEAFHLIRMNELYSEGSNKPIERLVAHFINSGYKLKQIEPLLKKFSSEPIAEVVKDLMDIPAIFNFDLADEDREEIKSLIAAPKKVVPEHLKQFRQIQLMRDFIL